jgi:hypothetical protein
MAHPFFNVTKYPLHRPEAVALIAALSETFNNSAAINTIYHKCEAGLPALFLGQAPPLIWQEALQNLTSHGALQKLLDLIQPQFKHSDVMQKVIRDVFNAHDGGRGEDYFGRCACSRSVRIAQQASVHRVEETTLGRDYFPHSLMNKIERPGLRSLPLFLLGPDPLEMLSRCVIGVPDNLN